MDILIDQELISYLERLSYLKLSEQEREAVRLQLSDILGYVKILDELDSDNDETLKASGLSNVFREDNVMESFDRERLLANAPRKKDGCWQVPRTVE